MVCKLYVIWLLTLIFGQPSSLDFGLNPPQMIDECNAERAKKQGDEFNTLALFCFLSDIKVYM